MKQLLSRQRVNPVTFIFMTGHANTGSNVGEGLPKNQAELITGHSNSKYKGLCNVVDSGKDCRLERRITRKINLSV
jgi:hypothetical protein